MSTNPNTDTDDGSETDSTPADIEYADLTAAGPADAGSSRDSALQYVAIDLLEAGVDDQAAHLEAIDDALANLDHYFGEAVGVAARHGENAAAEWLIGEVIDEIDTDTPAAERFAERLRQKHGNIALALDSALTTARRQATAELDREIRDWTEVV